MAIRNLNWYNLQSTRRYPLDDACTGEADNGADFVDDILVDCHIKFDAAYGQWAYLQAVTVSAGVVTVVIGASDNLYAPGTSIAAVTIVKPAYENINYTLTPLVAGVAGWVVFGSGINGPEKTFRFSIPQQSLLAPRCARNYQTLPIPSMQKLNLAEALQGVVNLVGLSPISLSYKTDTVGGQQRQLIVFSLNTADASLEYNPLSYFLSSCAQRPESGNCGKIPIETINGHAPDCFGNIEIDFRDGAGNSSPDFVGVPFADCGGIDITTSYGLKQACEGPPALSPFFSDLCCPQRFDSLAEFSAAAEANSDLFNVGDIVRIGAATGAEYTNYEYRRVTAKNSSGVSFSAALTVNDPNVKAALAKCDWPDPTELIPDQVINLITLQDYPELELPACIDFCSCDTGAPPLFDAIQGVFSSDRIAAPFGCIPCGGDGPAMPADMSALSLRNTYLATDTGGVALSLLKNAASDWAFGRLVTAQFKIGSAGVDRNGGVVINYRKVSRNGVLQTKYYAAVIDVGRGQLSLLDYTNNTASIAASVPMPVVTNQWYKMSVYPTIQGTYVYLNVTAEEMKTGGAVAKIIDYRVPLADYEPQTGAFGLYAERSYTYFNAFTIA